MDIPIGVKVECADGGECGQTTSIIVNPATDQVTHVVVTLTGLGGVPRMVPLDMIRESTPEVVRLRAADDELQDFAPFVEFEYVQGSDTYGAYAAGRYMLWPYATPAAPMLATEHEQTPPGELAIHRGTRVAATDGEVGRVDEFLVDPVDSRITHLILRQGHLWDKREFTIPAGDIERIEEDTVYLKLDRHTIEQLPAVPVNRRWE